MDDPPLVRGGEPPRHLHRERHGPPHGQVTGVDAPGEGLRALPNQVARGTAEDEKAGWGGVAVDQDPQDGKEVGPSLDLVDDDEAVERIEGQPGCGQALDVGGIFEVEVVQALVAGEGPAARDLTGERRLARLARPQQGHDGSPRQGCDDGICKLLSIHEL